MSILAFVRIRYLLKLFQHSVKRSYCTLGCEPSFQNVTLRSVPSDREMQLVFPSVVSRPAFLVVSSSGTAEVVVASLPCLLMDPSYPVSPRGSGFLLHYITNRPILYIQYFKCNEV
jgi:hypothetical protein